jgi:hypothetical protein
VAVDSCLAQPDNRHLQAVADLEDTLEQTDNQCAVHFVLADMVLQQAEHDVHHKVQLHHIAASSTH